MRLLVYYHMRLLCLFASLLLVSDAFARPTAGDDDAAAARTVVDRTYPVSEITFRYVEAFGAFPTVEQLGEVQVELGRVADEYVAPSPHVDMQSLRLNEIGNGRVQLSASAIAAIAGALREHLEGGFNTRFFAAVDPQHIDPLTGADLRRGRERALRFVIEYTGPTYQVEGFELNYLFEGYAGQPDISELYDVAVDLVPTEDAGYAAWRPGVEPVRMTLNEIAQRPVEAYSAAGVQQVLVTLRNYLTDRNLLAVHVAPLDQDELNARVDEPGTVSVVVRTGLVSEMRTLAVGDRIGPGPQRVNHPFHARIRDRSPVQPGDPDRQLLRRDIIDDYVFRLTRHPGRRVDVAIAPGEMLEAETGELVPGASLDYLVTENRPWTIYAQGSNTGTRNTGRWRQRFGLLHTQVTNRDDILNIDYQTAGFSDVHAVGAYYDFPLFGSERIRARINGHYSEFDASEVGFADLRFTGQSWSIGAEVAANVFQHRQLFLDLFLGARYLDTKVENFFFGFPITEGHEQFLFPYLGVRLERLTLKANTLATVAVEGQFGDVTSVDDSNINALGRLFPDRDWVVLSWDAQHSFFLEPLLNRAAWEDPETPRSSTLSHEIALAFRGQYAFDHRLIPQSMMVAGGMFTVRGYPESIVSADTTLIASAEYRFYLPRMFGLIDDPPEFLGSPFRWAPQHVYGRPDWDLIFRGFVDVARTINSDRLAFERDETLIGAGVGVEFLFRRNVNLRVDWGIALSDVEDRYSSGSSRVHFLGTLLF